MRSRGQAAAAAAERQGPAVEVGSLVRYRGEEEDEDEVVTVVRPEEADPFRRRISVDSPLARALLGRRAGERTTAFTPGGRRYLLVLAVQARTTSFT